MPWRTRAPHSVQAAVYERQRRAYARVEVDIPVRLEVSEGNATHQWDLHSRDVSGGGIALWFRETTDLQTGVPVTCKFTLPRDKFAVDAECVVVRLSDVNQNGYKVASVAFCDLREHVRQRIIQYIFWKQRWLYRQHDWLFETM